MSSYDSDEEPTAADETVLNKYKLAGEIARKVLLDLVKKSVPGAKLISLCADGDDQIIKETAALFKKDQKMKKGIAFPTTICVNNIICHYSPLEGETNEIEELNDGDLVKINLGAHLDGFSSIIGHTFVVGASSTNKVTGPKADAIVAANAAVEAVMRLLKPGNESTIVADTIMKVADEFSCKPVEGVQSHLMRKHVFDGEKAIVLNPSEDQKKSVEKCSFEMYEAWLVDVVISAGEGKVREHSARTTVYKKNDAGYQLKFKASRQFYSEISLKFQEYPFNLRMVEDLNKARYAATECTRHNVITALPVLADRDDKPVAQFKFTVILMPNGPMKITGLPFEASFYDSKLKIKDAQLKNLMSQPIRTSGQHKKTTA